MWIAWPRRKKKLEFSLSNLQIILYCQCSWYGRSKLCAWLISQNLIVSFKIIACVTVLIVSRWDGQKSWGFTMLDWSLHMGVADQLFYYVKNGCTDCIKSFCQRFITHIWAMPECQYCLTCNLVPEPTLP